MNTDMVRTIFTYVIALVVIVGGGALLVVPTQVPPEQLLPALTTVIGGVITYIFNERATTKATETAIKLTSPPTNDNG